MGLFDKFKSVFKSNEKKDIELYDKGLEKTRDEFVSKLNILGIKYTKVSDEYFDELEGILISADIGVNTVFMLLDKLKERVKEENITDTSELNEGKRVLLIAGDTFRAGAVEQLELWAKRVGVEFFGKEKSDPAGVIFDGLVKAKEDNIDIVLIDTAGRLQNKVGLMAELEKINKVIGRHIEGAPQETLLVIDASTGQNGISQAESFKNITNITGIVLTKLDGTAKGGIVLAIKESVGLPVKFIGLGEGEDDLKSFDIESYIYGLFKDMMKDGK